MPVPSTDPFRTAGSAGTFDPITLGHLYVIRRGGLLFEHLIVGIGVNPMKEWLFSIEERITGVQMVRPCTNVSVDRFEESTVQYVRRIGAKVILRGLRMPTEYGSTSSGMTLDQPSARPQDRRRTSSWPTASTSAHLELDSSSRSPRFGGASALQRFVPEELVEPILAKLHVKYRRFQSVVGRCNETVLPGDWRKPHRPA